MESLLRIEGGRHGAEKARTSSLINYSHRVTFCVKLFFELGSFLKQYLKITIQ